MYAGASVVTVIADYSWFRLPLFYVNALRFLAVSWPPRYFFDNRFGIFAMIAAIMKLSRTLFFPLLLVFALLFAQQAGAAHALHHAFEDSAQHQKNTPAQHSYTCEKCADYMQLGSALNSAIYHFTPLPVSDKTVRHRTIPLRSACTLSAVARGPPVLQAFI